jgi:hypothetical protein
MQSWGFFPRVVGCLWVLLSGPDIITQDIQHEAMAINIEVPVRVFKGDVFIDDLTMNDFEVYEDGVVQKIEAVYLIKKTDISREERSPEIKQAKKSFSPGTSRHFVLVFEIQDYLPKLEEAIHFFFETVISDGDTLRVVTPIKAYSFKSRALELIAKPTIARQLIEKLRMDLVRANADYRSLLQDLKSIREFEVDPDLKAMMYSTVLDRLKTLKCVEEKRLLDFAEVLKTEVGQKYVYIFFQKEIAPILGDGEASYSAPDDHIDKDFDVKKIERAFSDSTISSHFIYITPLQTDKLLDVAESKPMPGRNVQWQEFSQDIYSAFRELAAATGGLTETSANPAHAFKKVVEASENYYLLYYTPKDYRPDGRFRNIKIVIKGKDYAVLHRSGYVAD